jgi:hypothetical protein
LNKVPVVPGLSRQDIERKALAVLRNCQPEALRGICPVDIETIYELYIPDIVKVTIGYTDLSELLAPGILGYTNAAEKLSLVDKSLSDALDRPTLRRFRATASHEAGHCLMHVPVLRFFKSSSIGDGREGLYRANRADIPAYVDPEWQAWEFARALLMPRQLINEYCEKGFTEDEIADKFDVNPAFVRVRLATLKIKAS